jgi:hypothetical protein
MIVFVDLERILNTLFTVAFTIHFQTKLHKSISIWPVVVANKVQDKQDSLTASMLSYLTPSYLSQGLSTTRFQDSVLSGFVVSPTSRFLVVLKDIKKYEVQAT